MFRELSDQGTEENLKYGFGWNLPVFAVLTVKYIRNCSRLYPSTRKVKPSITLVTPDPVLLLVAEFHILLVACTTVVDLDMMKST